MPLAMLRGITGDMKLYIGEFTMQSVNTPSVIITKKK